MSWRDPYVALLPEAKEGLLFLDVETQGPADIREVGAPRYNAVIWPMAVCWAIDDGPIHRWMLGEDMRSLETVLRNHQGVFVAHNVEMEYWHLRHAFRLEIPPERWIDSAAVAAFQNLPRKLELNGVRLGEPKDMEGNRIMLKLTKPRRPSKDNPDLYWTPETKPEDFRRMVDYCAQDVRVSREILRRYKPITPNELRLAQLTHRMNVRGFAIDTVGVHRARILVRDQKQAITEEMSQIAGVTPDKVRAVANFIGIPSVAKHALRDYLKTAPQGPERRVAELRREYAKSSTAKLNAMHARHLEDGRIHDGLIYAGARATRRWTGGGVQPQNLPRGCGKDTDALFERLHKGARLDIDTLASMLRGFIVGPFYIGDFSQIEARLLAWLAHEDKALAAFADPARDPYREKAADIYHIPLDQITDTHRFMGKQAVLSAGYGVGAEKFQRMLDETYDVQISREEAETIVEGFRKSSPRIRRLWTNMYNAFERSRAYPQKKVPVPGTDIVIASGRTTTVVYLLSGQRITYYDVRRAEKPDKYGNHNWICYHPKYGQQTIYGGMLTGHYVQSTARELMGEALLRLDDARFPLVLTVHDEAVSEVDGAPPFEVFQRIMEQRPAWAKSLPIEVECIKTKRYRK